jgi:hypothetical protein
MQPSALVERHPEWRAGEPVTGVPAPFAAHRVAGSVP